MAPACGRTLGLSLGEWPSWRSSLGTCEHSAQKRTHHLTLELGRAAEPQSDAHHGGPMVSPGFNPLLAPEHGIPA